MLTLIHVLVRINKWIIFAPTERERSNTSNKSKVEFRWNWFVKCLLPIRYWCYTCYIVPYSMLPNNNSTNNNSSMKHQQQRDDDDNVHAKHFVSNFTEMVKTSYVHSHTHLRHGVSNFIDLGAVTTSQWNGKFLIFHDFNLNLCRIYTHESYVVWKVHDFRLLIVPSWNGYKKSARSSVPFWQLNWWF